MEKIKDGDKVKQNWKVIKVENFPHPDDQHLQYCLVEREKNDFQPFVCYLYNADIKSFNHGHYYSELEKAEEKFKERLEYYGLV